MLRQDVESGRRSQLYVVMKQQLLVDASPRTQKASRVECGRRSGAMESASTPEVYHIEHHRTGKYGADITLLVALRSFIIMPTCFNFELDKATHRL